MDCQDYITEPAERKKGQHLQREERGAIQHLKRQGYLNRAIAGEIGCSPATQQGVERPSTRPTESFLGDAIGFAAAPVSFVGWQGSSKNTSGLWMPISIGTMKVILNRHSGG